MADVVRMSFAVNTDKLVSGKDHIELWEDGDQDGPALSIKVNGKTIDFDHFTTCQIYQLLSSRSKELKLNFAVKADVR